MKHAGPDTFAKIVSLLDQIRALSGLREPRPGVFYRRSKAFLHFHDDASGVYADLRRIEGGDFERFKVEPNDQGATLIALIETALTEP